MLNTVEVRGDRRIRLTFDAVLTSGAFTSTSYYVVTTQNSVGASPTVRAALVVPTSTYQVELVLSCDLSSGGTYTVTATSVPGGGSGTLYFQLAQTQVLANVEPLATDSGAFFYGRDLTHDGNDFVETAGGDLTTTEGTPNVTAALARRINSIQLPYDPTYGLDVREYVDAPQPTATALKGQILKQITSDVRIKTADVTMTQSLEQTFFNITAYLVGNETLPTVTLKVPT